MYITNAELGIPEDLLIRLTDDEGSGMANTARADDAIRAASGYVDAALSRRFATPVAQPTELVKTLTREIAVYNLYMRAGAVPEAVGRAYDEARAVLARAADGLVSLGLTPEMEGPEFVLPDREFTRRHMKGF